ncbi:primosomal protein N' [Clostridium sp. DSM 100503]|uniref:primosomal protein N' n=1 Tax=Clostridium sp. DSM 100503 TaxID=2963282 RepID=UPI002149F0C1|nr:primosomal protein N' [Clostridium sp. DSM 100503]MCR1951485.1 primosomal protein N' [Clostridium sp. DSM 100503]
MKIYAQIIINSDALDIDKPFTYEIPDDLKSDIRVGQWVKVPFGMKNSLVDGFILSIKEDEIKGIRIKKIKSIGSIEPLLNNDDLRLVYFIRENYLCKYIDAIRLLIPQGVLKGAKNKYKMVIALGNKSYGKDVEEKYGDILKFIKDNNGKFNKNELVNLHSLSLYKINKLIKEGYLKVDEEIVYRYNDKEYIDYKEKKLTKDQIKALEKIEKSDKKVFLLKGVTGSGKTEVYMKLVSDTIRDGKCAIVLVPEISLTPQMIERFKGRFGKEVAVFHSKLSDGERYDEWFRVKEGKAKLVIGARSALFLPAPNLGVIIIDEEHESTYKSEQNPKYVTREVAEFLSEIKDCKVILGSATPSIETYYRAITEEIELVELNNRIDNKPMPIMDIVDMREELNSGNVSMFSRKLFTEINEALNKKEQIILFLNRRGFSTFVSCRSCGYVFKCPKCDIAMTFHKNGYLVCHYCGYGQKQQKICPKCKSKYVKHFGAGTERVEEEVKKYFKDARVLRMDVDTTRGKNSHEEIYKAFKNGEGDILIGTQMISKGLDFENVTLVGILAADMSINIPDYRSAERTFQIVTQVAGRAGRGSKEGKVIVQTYNPEHYSLIYAKNYNYEGFYDEEFTTRGLMYYPPFGKILLVNVSSKNENSLKDFMKLIKGEMEIIKDEYLNIEMLGPVPCIVSKIKDNYRWQILFKGDLSLDFCKKIKDKLYQLNKNVYNEVKVTIDINPNNLT